MKRKVSPRRRRILRWVDWSKWLAAEESRMWDKTNTERTDQPAMAADGPAWPESRIPATAANRPDRSKRKFRLPGRKTFWKEKRPLTNNSDTIDPTSSTIRKTP